MAEGTPFTNRQSLSVSPRGPCGCRADGADAKEAPYEDGLVDAHMMIRPSEP
jgi:hypothetical protein